MRLFRLAILFCFFKTVDLVFKSKSFSLHFLYQSLNLQC